MLGAGERLFGDTTGQKPMRLTDTATVGDGLVRLTYEAIPARLEAGTACLPTPIAAGTFGRHGA